MAGLQVPVVSPGDDPVEESQLALAAVGGGDDLVPVHDGAAADVTAETLQRDLPRELVWQLELTLKWILTFTIHVWAPPLLQ